MDFNLGHAQTYARPAIVRKSAYQEMCSVGDNRVKYHGLPNGII